MSRFLTRIILYVFSNAIALFLAARYVPGLVMQTDFLSVLTVAAMLTALNLFLRPILRFILSPLVILTFGLAVIALNAFLLHLLDIWSEKITITGTLSLLYATIIVGAVNIVIGFFTRPLFHREL